MPQTLFLFDQDQRIGTVWPEMRREAWPHLVRHTNLTTNGEGMVLYSRLDEGNADAVIAEQIADFSGIGQNFEWKLYEHDTPADLKERLVAHGFEIGEDEAVMVLDLVSAPGLLRQPVTHDVRRLTSPDQLHDLFAVQDQVWGNPPGGLRDYLSAALTVHPDLMSIYVAYVQGEPASAAWVYFHPDSQFASLWGGSTVERFRKQGLYTAMLAIRLQEALTRGYHYLTVDASYMSRPILARFGFETITYAYACQWRVF